MTTRYIVRDKATAGADFLLWGDDDPAAALVSYVDAMIDCGGDEIELVVQDVPLWGAREIDDLAEDALNLAAAHIQERLGQTDGGVAGMVFSDGAAKDLLKIYIRTEIAFLKDA